MLISLQGKYAMYALQILAGSHILTVRALLQGTLSYDLQMRDFAASYNEELKPFKDEFGDHHPSICSIIFLVLRDGSWRYPTAGNVRAMIKLLFEYMNDAEFAMELDGLGGARIADYRRGFRLWFWAFDREEFMISRNRLRIAFTWASKMSRYIDDLLEIAGIGLHDEIPGCFLYL